MDDIIDISLDDEKVTEFVEVTMSVSMSKSICLEVPEGCTKEELLERAKKEIITPDKIMAVMKDLLARHTGYVVTEGDDWIIDEVEVVQ